MLLEASGGGDARAPGGHLRNSVMGRSNDKAIADYRPMVERLSANAVLLP
jgi:hypothetical protein